MILDSLVILIMKNVNIARLYFLYGGLYWKILAKTIVWYLSVSKWRIFKMKLKNKLAGLQILLERYAYSEISGTFILI